MELINQKLPVMNKIIRMKHAAFIFCWSCFIVCRAEHADSTQLQSGPKFGLGIGWNFITTFPSSPLIGSKNAYGGYIPQQIHFLYNYKVNRGFNFYLAVNSREFGPNKRRRDLRKGETTNIDFTSIAVDHVHFKSKPKTQFGIIESFYFRYSPYNGQRIFYGMANPDEGITGSYSLLSPGVGIGFLAERKISKHLLIGSSFRYCYYFETPKYENRSDKYILEDLGTKPNRRIGAFSVYFSFPFFGKNKN